MSIHVYNSLTRTKEEFIPHNPPRVNMYTCGVTVYDDSHIGHARSLYIFDVMRRYLKLRGYDVRFVRNITDIDDKIINRAKELKADWKGIVKKYIDRYCEDLKILGIEKADFEPRATENIDEMITYIQGLIEKDFAYESQGDVYFNVRKFSQYGKLSGQSIDQMERGVRIESSDLKRDHLDFALWKKAKENEPSWPSPWGAGRPGWHIECSVMSQKFLHTDTLDIHAGGRDLIFPHHENEIAQAEALTAKPFARYWIHHGLLTINGQKMSKSLGNFLTIRDFSNEYKDMNLLRLFFLSAHYSHPLDFNDASIEEARKQLERISIFFNNALLKLKDFKPSDKVKKFPEIEKMRDRFFEAMDDDFNMPQALAAIFDLVNLGNKNIDNLECTYRAKNVLNELRGIFNVGVSVTVDLNEQAAAKENIAVESVDAEVKAKIKQREAARKNKDFRLADTIRKELEQKGIILEDTSEGTLWRRKI